MSDTIPFDMDEAIELLVHHAPFDRMDKDHLRVMVGNMRLVRYDQGEVILAPEQTIPCNFFVIRSGCVQGEQAVARADEDEAHWQLSGGECFPLGALLAKRPVVSLYRASEDTECFELPMKHFDALLAQSPPFHDFCTRRLANLLEQSKRVIQAQFGDAAADRQSMNSRLSTVVRRTPIACRPATPLRDVLETMHVNGIGSIAITDDAGRPLGIFTLRDLLGRVALPQHDLSQPIGTVMSTELQCLAPQAFAYEAALQMALHRISHIMVVDNDRLLGVISEKDLLSLQRVGLRQISSAIRSAETVEKLQRASVDIRELAQNMLAQGVAADQLTQFLSTLNDMLGNRVIEIESSLAPEGIDFCWIALGSEGRFEQTLSTDQDNGLIFVPPPGMPAATARKLLLPLAKRINKALDKCGFPLCKGEVMAGNPRWCLSLDEWKSTFAEWIDQGDPDSLLNATIFFDFRPLHGNHGLAQDLRDWLKEKAASNTRFLHQMARNALRNRPPLGLVRDFVVEEHGGEQNTVDLKLNGASPFVDAARIFALATGVEATNTVQRLRAAAPALNIAEAEVEAWISAFLFVQMLRLRHQQLQHTLGRSMNNYVDPDVLNDLDRRILKEAFRQSRKLQTRLGLDYRV